MALNLYVCGLNHTTAPVAVREQAHGTTWHPAPTLAGAAAPDRTLFPEFLSLNTCNRTELYAVATDEARARQALRAALPDFATPADAPDPVYLYAGRAAVTHLFAVAAGLDSLVLGEFEILGQVRRAYQQACADDTAGPLLHQLAAAALRLGKRARVETEIAHGALSVATTGLNLVRHELGTLAGRTVLVIGAGEMGRRTAEHLHSQADSTLVIANRTYAHARMLAERVRGEAVTLDAVPDVLAHADLVVTATHAPPYLLDAALVTRARAGADRPLWLLDLAMPRNIEPAVAQLPHVRLYTLDDLTAHVAQTRAQRAGAIAAVQEMIQAEADDFEAWLRERTAAPVIAGLYARGEAIREAEVDKALRHLQHLPLTPRDRAVIAGLAAGVANKLLAVPARQLKAHAAQDDARIYFDTVRDLFEL